MLLSMLLRMLLSISLWMLLSSWLRIYVLLSKLCGPAAVVAILLSMLLSRRQWNVAIAMLLVVQKRRMAAASGVRYLTAWAMASSRRIAARVPGSVLEVSRKIAIGKLLSARVAGAGSSPERRITRVTRRN